MKFNFHIFVLLSYASTFPLIFRPANKQQEVEHRKSEIQEFENQDFDFDGQEFDFDGQEFNPSFGEYYAPEEDTFDDTIDIDMTKSYDQEPDLLQEKEFKIEGFNDTLANDEGFNDTLANGHGLDGLETLDISTNNSIPPPLTPLPINPLNWTQEIVIFISGAFIALLIQISLQKFVFYESVPSRHVPLQVHKDAYYLDQVLTFTKRLALFGLPAFFFIILLLQLTISYLSLHHSTLGEIAPINKRSYLFCEPIDKTAIVKQPTNAYSSLGFLLVMVIIACLPAPESFHFKLKGTSGYAYKVLVSFWCACLGLFSFYYHASLTDYADHLDFASILLPATGFLAFSICRWTASRWYFTIAFTLFILFYTIHFLSFFFKVDISMGFGLSTVVVTFISEWIRQYRHFKEPDSVEEDIESLPYLNLMFIFLLVGLSCWMLDTVFRMCLPVSGGFQLHSIFHFTFSLGVFFGYLYTSGLAFRPCLSI